MRDSRLLWRESRQSSLFGDDKDARHEQQKYCTKIEDEIREICAGRDCAVVLGVFDSRGASIAEMR